MKCCVKQISQLPQSPSHAVDAREALIDCLSQRKATRDEIWQYAKTCHMTNIMRPYLEMAQ